MDIKKANESSTSGVYTIYPPLPTYSCGMQVYCDQETDGGGWIVSYNLFKLLEICFLSLSRTFFFVFFLLRILTT